MKVRGNEHGRVWAFGVIHEDAIACSNSPNTLVKLVHLTAFDRDARRALEQHRTETCDHTGFLTTRQSGNRFELPVEDVRAKRKRVCVGPLQLARRHDEEAAIRRP